MTRLVRNYWLALFLILITLVCVFWLERLPYSTSLLEKGVASQKESPPTSSGFSVGSLAWDMPAYSRDPSLEPYREVYHRACRRDEIGLAAAVRISDVFANSFSNGNPRFELFHADYEPATTLYMHLGGAAGHCVTRAGLLATTLLSVGIPARMIQVVGPEGGHNIIEVWDGPEEWVMFDPTKGVAFRSKDQSEKFPHRLSAFEVLRMEGDVSLERVAMESKGTDLSKLIGPDFFKGSILYPEPWLYTRVLPRTSYWPFRGRFVYFGVRQWDIGPAQFFFRCVIVICWLALFLQASLFAVRAMDQGTKARTLLSILRHGTTRSQDLVRSSDAIDPKPGRNDDSREGPARTHVAQLDGSLKVREV